jgi:hypothetical protein
LAFIVVLGNILEDTMKQPLALALAVALALGTAVPSLSAAKPATVTELPVVGAVTGGGNFAGTLNLTKFATQSGALVAVGTLAGTLTNGAGQTTTILQTVALPVANVTGTCDILHLDIGPIALDLLGLKVDLSRIVLDITAEAGAGNLLGNLLCGVANLLNDPSGLAGLLNRILALL